MIINIASMENLVRAQRLLQSKTGDVRVLMINLARSTQQLDDLRLSSQSIFLAHGAPHVDFVIQFGPIRHK